MRRGILLALLLSLTLARPVMANERLPFWDIVDTVRSLAAQELGRKKADVSTIDSLFKQGMRESQFSNLVNAIQNEFNVVLPEREIQQQKWNDPVVGLSVRRLAELVQKEMQQGPP